MTFQGSTFVGGLIIREHLVQADDDRTVEVVHWAAQTSDIRVRLMAHLRENYDRILVLADSGAA